MNYDQHESETGFSMSNNLLWNFIGDYA